MTTAALRLAIARPRRQSILIAGVVIGAIAALLFWQYRVVASSAPAQAAEQDTLCVASRIGLPCR